MGFDSLSSPGQGIPGFSGIHGNTERKKKKIKIQTIFIIYNILYLKFTPIHSTEKGKNS